MHEDESRDRAGQAEPDEPLAQAEPRGVRRDEQRQGQDEEDGGGVAQPALPEDARRGPSDEERQARGGDGDDERDRQCLRGARAAEGDVEAAQSEALRHETGRPPGVGEGADHECPERNGERCRHRRGHEA